MSEGRTGKDPHKPFGCRMRKRGTGKSKKTLRSRRYGSPDPAFAEMPVHPDGGASREPAKSGLPGFSDPTDSENNTVNHLR